MPTLAADFLVAAANFFTSAASFRSSAANFFGSAANFFSSAANSLCSAAYFFGSALSIAVAVPARMSPENIVTKFVPGTLPWPSSGTPVAPVSPFGVVPLTVS